MRKILALCTALAAVACGGPPPPTGPAPIRGRAVIPATWTLRARPVTAPHAMVVTAHPLATQAGVDILKQGGNAIDAAVAVAFALEVVLPDAGNIGGGGFIVQRTAGGEVTALDYREAAPAAATHDMFVDSAGNPTKKSEVGHLAAGVPGSVAGLYEAWKKYGSLPWATLIAPAIRLAQGHLIDAERSGDIAADRELLAQFPASRAQFLVHDSAPPAGAMWRQPDLARTLQLISDSGPDVFYRGQIADLIVSEMQRGGGLITKDDLRRYRAKWRTPITLTYRGHTIYSMPPPSSGGVTMGEILNILEGYDTLPAFGTPAYVHLVTEAMRRAFIDRNRWLGDPDFVDMPIERLLSKSYAATLRAQIDPQHATPTPPQTASDEAMHTTHYSIVDAQGNAAAVTTTLNGGFGSGVTVTGAGFLLNNEMDDFATAPGKPNMYGLVQGENNAVAGGKRMLSAMTPSIVLDSAGNLQMVVGTPGGPTIITSVAQVILNVLDQKMSLGDAVAAPRIHHQALPDQTYYEHGGLSDATVRALEAMGHKMEQRRGRSGIIAAIQKTAGGWVGVADPRYAGGALGY
ncbi:MAG TPA: gamma-glutamyltransferase [Gemmatimonadales bacterium]|jgi:gamma-glutamyltranspeptidase/glutathione hydrolase|nr:gamma-glutamyltransferase [Gemmatimonadales bacterium]